LSQTGIFIDFDDTLFPGTELARIHNVDNPEKLPILLQSETSKHMQILSEQIERLIRALHVYGLVFIVTNANATWVFQCCRAYFPSLYPILLAGVRIYSARDLFESQFPGDCVAWKVHTFCMLQKQHDLKHILSIGDGIAEYKAMQQWSYDTVIKTKTITTCAAPSLKTIEMQIHTLLGLIPRLCGHTDESLDLVMELPAHLLEAQTDRETTEGDVQDLTAGATQVF
jgi:hypothetical protein